MLELRKKPLKDYIQKSKIYLKRELTFLKLNLFNSSLPIFTQIIWALFTNIVKLKNSRIRSRIRSRNKRNYFFTNGFADIGLINDLDKLAINNIVKPYLNIKNQTLVSLPREENDDLARYIFKFLKQFKKEICEIIGSEFQTFFIEVQKTVKSDVVDLDSSFAWHCDEEPKEMIKLYLYLSDTTRENGAFRTFNRKISKQLFSKRFISNTPFDRIKSQNLITKSIGLKSKWIERKSGALFCFDNSLIHKATHPIKGERIIISLMIYPSSDEIKLENVRKSLSMPLESYPVLPWKNPCK